MFKEKTFVMPQAHSKVGYLTPNSEFRVMQMCLFAAESTEPFFLHLAAYFLVTVVAEQF